MYCSKCYNDVLKCEKSKEKAYNINVKILKCIKKHSIYQMTDHILMGRNF